MRPRAPPGPSCNVKCGDLTLLFSLTENRTGCLFITVDAYNNPETTAFYEKNGFTFLWSKDRRHKTRIMWFNLATYMANN